MRFVGLGRRKYPRTRIVVRNFVGMTKPAKQRGGADDVGIALNRRERRRVEDVLDSNVVRDAR